MDKTTCSKCGHASYVHLHMVEGVILCGACKSKAQHPHWPRGRWNGQRIMGASVKFAIDLAHCRVRPRWNKYTRCFAWLWFLCWIEAVYE